VGKESLGNFLQKTTMIDRIDNLLLPQRTALNLRGFRHELLASNIANADTPNYKARDVDFKSAFATALNGQDAGALNLNQTSGRHMQGVGGTPYANLVQYRTEFQSAVDGNTVNMDIERGAFAENAINMEASLTFIREQLRTLSSALQSQ
jgi:flagellar basal-body rod protein FlgB